MASARRTSTPGQREADGAGAALAVVGVRHDHDRLGHAVALEHGLPAARRRRARGARRGSGAEPDTHSRSGPSSPARAQAARRAYIVGTPKNSVAPWRPRRRARRPRSKPGEQDGRRPGQQRAVQADAQPVHVEQRQGTGPAGPSAVHRQASAQRLAARQQVAVGEHRPLRRAGGARRVREEGRVVGSDGVEGRCGERRGGRRRRRPRRRRGRPRPGPSRPARRRRPRRPAARRRARRGPPPARCRRCWPAPRPARAGARPRGPPPGRPRSPC